MASRTYTVSIIHVIFIVFLMFSYVILQQSITNEKLFLQHQANSLLNFTRLSVKHGYFTEEHTVYTEDGYLLTIFRMVKSKKCYDQVKNPPVILMHGLLMSSDSWFDAGPEASLAYLLSDECFDI
ncbi:unnamed protein product [Parnassius mnemosyne]|uniref:Partial AB-hydrolase lipase domain-containing protein n=1 Tax=Parnassius mnemosyne TaxID=213953 RepID=A0AAV1L692_9NEOP